MPATKLNGRNKIRGKKSDSSGKVFAMEQETRNNVFKVAEIEETQKIDRTIGEKIADAIESFCRSMVFVYDNIVWFTVWILLNSMFTFAQFDPFPYTFLTLVVSLEAIFLSTFILISQNYERLTERRNRLDLQKKMLAEQEITKMLGLIGRVADKVGV